MPAGAENGTRDRGVRRTRSRNGDSLAVAADGVYLRNLSRR